MDKTLRTVLLGKTGAGKSSLANTIFGEKLFNINHTLSSQTRKCQAETRSVSGRSVTLIDTPSFFDTKRSEEELRPEILRCITECAPGPHAFLLVLKVEKFTEHAIIETIKQYFSEEVFKYAAVVFTHGDQLPEGWTIGEFVRQNKLVSDLVKKCGGRCHVVDNKYWNGNPTNEYRSNQFQVEELLKTIDKMVMENNGSCFTNEMLPAVEEKVQQESVHIRSTSERGVFRKQSSADQCTNAAKRTFPSPLAMALAAVGFITGYYVFTGANTHHEAVRGKSYEE